MNTDISDEEIENIASELDVEKEVIRDLIKLSEPAHHGKKANISQKSKYLLCLTAVLAFIIIGVIELSSGYYGLSSVTTDFSMFAVIGVYTITVFGIIYREAG
jgi:hypothetical protein